MIVVDRACARWTGTPTEWEALAGQVRKYTCVHLRGFLDPSLLEEIRALLDRTTFVEQSHGGFAVDERAEPGPLVALLLLVLNDGALLRLVERLTGCGPLGGFEGRVYRMAAGHHDAWHDDAGEGRRAAISINLNRDVVATAPLQIRARDSDSVLYEFANATPGDAVLFTLDEAHVHRVKPTEGMPARIACAGWFSRGADMREWLRGERG